MDKNLGVGREIRALMRLENGSIGTVRNYIYSFKFCTIKVFLYSINPFQLEKETKFDLIEMKMTFKKKTN